jgi:hypothetical protein
MSKDLQLDSDSKAQDRIKNNEKIYMKKQFEKPIEEAKNELWQYRAAVMIEWRDANSDVLRTYITDMENALNVSANKEAKNAIEKYKNDCGTDTYKIVWNMLVQSYPIALYQALLYAKSDYNTQNTLGSTWTCGCWVDGIYGIKTLLTSAQVLKDSFPAFHGVVDDEAMQYLLGNWTGWWEKEAWTGWWEKEAWTGWWEKEAWTGWWEKEAWTGWWEKEAWTGWWEKEAWTGWWEKEAWTGWWEKEAWTGWWEKEAWTGWWEKEAWTGWWEKEAWTGWQETELEQDDEKKKLEQDDEKKKLEQDDEKKKLEQDDEKKKLEQDDEKKKLEQDDEKKKLEQDDEKKKLEQDDKQQQLCSDIVTHLWKKVSYDKGRNEFTIDGRKLDAKYVIVKDQTVVSYSVESINTTATKLLVDEVNNSTRTKKLPITIGIIKDINLWQALYKGQKIAHSEFWSVEQLNNKLTDIDTAAKEKLKSDITSMYKVTNMISNTTWLDQWTTLLVLSKTESVEKKWLFKKKIKNKNTTEVFNPTTVQIEIKKWFIIKTVNLEDIYTPDGNIDTIGINAMMETEKKL